MLSYCLRYREKKESKSSRVVKVKNGRIKVSLNCAFCDSQKSRFIKEQGLNLIKST